MITKEEFEKIRQNRHFIVLDTSVLLELYRQPSNISKDIIDVFRRIKECLYIPYQVKLEFQRNSKRICGIEKKRYKNIQKELTNEVFSLKNALSKKMGEYFKHNYTDVRTLQSKIDIKIDEIEKTINEYEINHSTEIKANEKFLNEDKVSEFFEELELENKIGIKFSYTEKLIIIQEGEIRFRNLLPPGYKDCEKEGIDKYGDLFIWKEILKFAKDETANIIFITNDLKEDWWNEEKEADIREELVDEFNDINPDLEIHFLTLEKVFSYLSEEFKIGYSKSALQLSAMDDAKDLLDKYGLQIKNRVHEIINSIDFMEEIGKSFIFINDFEMDYSINDVTVDKEGRNIIYYLNLEIDVIADVAYEDTGDTSKEIEKVAVILDSKIEIEKEEYSYDCEMKEFIIQIKNIFHINSYLWKLLNNTDIGDSCNEFISISQKAKKYLYYIMFWYYEEKLSKLNMQQDSKKAKDFIIEWLNNYKENEY